MTSILAEGGRLVDFCDSYAIPFGVKGSIHPRQGYPRADSMKYLSPQVVRKFPKFSEILGMPGPGARAQGPGPGARGPGRL